MSKRETLEFDVLIVGAGPAGLSAGIFLRRLAVEKNLDISVCVVEKAAEIGAHSLAGAVLESRALDELIPDWATQNSPIKTAVTKDTFAFLTKSKKWNLPTPPPMQNHGNHIISLGRFVRWLGERAESAGCEVYPGFAAAEILYDGDAVCGVATGDMGIGKNGDKTANYQPGVELRAKYTLFAEGCRGSLSGELIQKFSLATSPQTYGIGIKELWETPNATPGEVLHTVGWPLAANTYGGSFLYHLETGKIALGLVVGLDYKNPHLSPYLEFQRFKHHPAVAALLAGGRRIGYGARALNEGGWQSIPRLTVDGALLIGCAAGFLNVAKIKGIHTAMKSGMLAAATVADSLQKNESRKNLTDYETALRNSWVGDELKKVRNIRPAFRRGLFAGLGYAAADTYIFRGRAPWTFRHHADHLQLKPAAACKIINYPKPDGVLSFSRLDNLAYSGVFHDDNQPPHLQLRNADTPMAVNWQKYAGPESHYCPAGVYEFVGDGEGRHLVINAQNCVHCKTCDIKDPTQNIRWTTPEGGGGPNYDSL